MQKNPYKKSRINNQLGHLTKKSKREIPSDICKEIEKAIGKTNYYAVFDPSLKSLQVSWSFTHPIYKWLFKELMIKDVIWIVFSYLKNEQERVLPFSFLSSQLQIHCCLGGKKNALVFNILFIENTVEELNSLTTEKLEDIF